MNLQLFALKQPWKLIVDGDVGKKTNLPLVTNNNQPVAVQYLNTAGEEPPKTDAPNATEVKPFAQSAEATEAQKKQNDALNTYTGMSAPSVNDEYMKALNTPFTPSSAYTDAMALLTSMSDKLSSGRTSYTDQIQSVMNQIQNRDKFSYDVNTDMLFQQALASSMASGRQAMQDTMGQASALTGGYASTYAQSVGNQAYNSYIQDAYNNLPEYYQIALDAYNMEGQEMYDRLAMLSEADATEYGRMLDSYNIKRNETTDLYDREYGAYQDNWSNIYNMANLDLNQQGMALDKAYNDYNVFANNYNTIRANEYSQWADAESIRNNNEQARLDREHDAEQAGLDREHDYLMKYDLNGDKVVDDKDTAIGSVGGDDMSTMTAREIDTFVNTVLSAENEEAGYEAGRDYLVSIGKSETDFAELDFAIEEEKKKREEAKAKEEEAYYKLPAWERNWTISDDTKNRGFLWWKGVDHNDSFTDGKNSYTYDELEKMLKDSKLSDKDKEEFLKKLSTQSKR